jgi:hypothetical protein
MFNGILYKIKFKKTQEKYLVLACLGFYSDLWIRPKKSVLKPDY